MNEEYEELVKSLRDKIKKLISLYEKEKEAKVQLALDKEALMNQLDEKENQVKDLERKYEVLRIAKTVTGSSENSHEAKIKVNRIVREIDKCIALLNR